MKTAVFDTCVLIRLSKGNLIKTLSGLFDEILITEAVFRECVDAEISEALKQSPFKIVSVEKTLPIGMGLGEREAISLAVERDIKFIFTDDEKAYKKAEKLGLFPMRSFWILIAAKENGLIPSVTEALHTMQKNGEGIHRRTYLEAIELAGEA